MLSVSRIKTATRAAAYYGRDDYYLTGEADAPGLAWGGKAAARLGLEGSASEKAFKAILRGVNPTPGAPPLSVPEKGRAHHPGWDFTFSAPKSVSLAILVGGDARLDAAHDRAVAKAMDYAEKHLSFTRVRKAGQRREVATGNLLYATTVHGVSRAGDPQRHTHVVIANATWHHASASWRALESRHLYRRRMLLGKIYQAELAKAALELGYDVRPAGGKGVYELAAWSREQLQVFAKRTQAIMRALEFEKPATAAAREAVKLKDRPRKIGLAREDLQARWREEAKGAAMDVDGVVTEARAKPSGEAHMPTTAGRVSERLSRLRALAGRLMGDRGAPDPYAPRSRDAGGDVEARHAVSAGVQLQEIRSAVFTRHDVLETALDWARPGLGIDRLVQDLGRLEFDDKVRRADRHLADGVTTSNALAIETEIVGRLRAGRGKGAAVWSQGEAPGRINAIEAASKLRLNLGQRQAALMVLTSQDRYVAIQGFAGVGKTTMFKAVRAAAADGGYEITAITPTHRAAAAMRSEAGVHATTVAAWLASMAKVAKTRSGQRAAGEHWKARILVVDEASMVSNAQMLAVVQAADRLEVRKVVLMGDERQLGSPEAGAPFRMALGRDIDQSRMRAILRQKDPTLRDAVAQLAEGRAPAALRMIDDHVFALGRQADDLTLAKAAVAAWKAGAQVGDAPRIVVPTNMLRGLVANLVREERITARELASDAVSVDRYQHVRLAGPERHAARAHRVGQRLVFHAAFASAGLRRGAETDIVGLDMRNDVLRVATALGDASIDLRALARAGRIPFDVYQPQAVEVAAGEQLVWERAEPRRGYMTGAGFTVVGMTDTHWTIRHHDGREEQLRADDPALRFIGYDYAETADRAQGQTYRSVVAVLASRDGEAVTAARQYVMQSRPSHAFTLITDDKRLLIRRLAEQDGLGRIATENVVATLASAISQSPAHQAHHSDKVHDPASRSPVKDHGRSM